MKLFVSWSGAQSRAFAEFLKDWIPTVLPNGIDVFVSSQDIDKGGRGQDTIAQALEEGDFGVIILTRESRNAQWVNFEAGALSRTVSSARVAPLLLDLAKADVSGPLTQFQMTSANDRTDVKKLVDSLNRATGHELPTKSLEILFEQCWSDFEQRVEAAGAAAGEASGSHRTDREMIEELLLLTRQLRREQKRDVRPLHDGAANHSVKRRNGDSHRLVTEFREVLPLADGINLTSAGAAGFESLEASVDHAITDDLLGDLAEVAQEWGTRITVHSGGKAYSVGP